MSLLFGLCCILFGVLLAGSPVIVLGTAVARKKPEERGATALLFGAGNGLAVALGMAAMGWFIGSDMPAERAGDAKVFMALAGGALGFFVTFGFTAGGVLLASRSGSSGD